MKFNLTKNYELAREFLNDVKLITSGLAHKSLALIVLVLVVFSFVELLGVSAIFAFIAIITDPSLIESNEYYLFAYQALEFGSQQEYIVFFGFFILSFYVLRGLYNIYYYYVIATATQELYRNLVKKLFKAFLNYPYSNFTKINNSEMSKAIINEAHNFTGLITSALLLISEFFVICFILTLLFVVNFEITLALIVVILVMFALVIRPMGKKVKKAGDLREQYQRSFFEIINTSFQNYKLLKVSSDIAHVHKKYDDSALGYSKANVVQMVHASLPRIVLETSGFMIIILVILALLSFNYNVETIIPALTIFALSFYRILPSFNRIIVNYHQILFTMKSLNLLKRYLSVKGEMLGDKEVSFSHSIRFENVSFSYGDKVILKDVNLHINKGEKIGLIGPSGQGKSTLIDLLLGLYRPLKGGILVDDVAINHVNIRSFRSIVSYIPQKIFLSSGSVGENVSFGSDFDKKKYCSVMNTVGLFDFFENLNGHNTLIGEDGELVSGGQRERIAIARALYKDPEVLILDESTSALDKVTEARIMDFIIKELKGITVIIITHAPDTLHSCDYVYNISDINHKL